MLFNSLDFAIFLPVVFILYWFVFNKTIRIQNFLIVVASFTFYGWWDWRFLFLLLFSCLLDYTMGRLLLKEENETKRKVILWISICINLGFLGFFKYYNFFVDSFVNAFTFFGRSIQPNTLDIILPLGISFYTFQTLSYVIDVYRRKLEPTKDIVSFLAYVSFFPQLVAGPIERAINLLPQFYVKRTFKYDKAIDGLKQILWGLFKKMVIADSCAQFVNTVFSSPDSYSGSTLLLGAVFFTIQIYGDFSGYSDIAIGTARLFGFNLMRNFAYPYFSRDLGEFWRRWHISLTTWFRDYLYNPLGGVTRNIPKRIRNIFIIFLVSGFWHGANWTYIIWGGLCALATLPTLLLLNRRRKTPIVAQNTKLPSLRETWEMFSTMLIISVINIFFRSVDLHHAVSYLGRVFSFSLFSFPSFPSMDKSLLALIVIFFGMEWMGRKDQYAIQNTVVKFGKFPRYAFYYLLIFVIFYFAGVQQEFIYFQF
ncbi:MAG: MBOAT family O-acyltransferase [Ginsengibacter sp.]